VVNHELGHVHHKHIVWQIVASSVQLTFMFSLFALVLGNKDALLSFGFSFESNFIYLFIFQAMFSPLGFFTQFFSMYMTRRAEY